jgi:hypothetical protein
MNKESVILNLAQTYPLTLQKLLLTKARKEQFTKMVLAPTPQFKYMLRAGVCII